MSSINDALKLYGWGRNEFRQLGILNDSFDLLVTTPKLVMNDSTQHQIIKVACGREHSIFITNNGKVYGVGRSSEGQLGSEFIKVDKVKKPEKISLDDYFIIDAAASDLCTLLLTDDGKVLCMGLGLGLLHTEKKSNQTLSFMTSQEVQQNVHNSKIPYCFDELKNEKVISIACGPLHYVAITETGNVFTWGRG